MATPIPAWIGTDDNGKKVCLDLVDPDNRRRVLRMLGEAPYPGEFSNSAFQARVDLDTLRAQVLAHRHGGSGCWQLRIDGLTRSAHPVWREEDGYESNANHPKLVYRHMSSDHGGVNELNARFSARVLPDGSSRLVAKVIAHFASQAFGEGKAEGWVQRQNTGRGGMGVGPVADHIARALDPNVSPADFLAGLRSD